MDIEQPHNLLCQAMAPIPQQSQGTGLTAAASRPSQRGGRRSGLRQAPASAPAVATCAACRPRIALCRAAPPAAALRPACKPAPPSTQFLTISIYFHGRAASGAAPSLQASASAIKRNKHVVDPLIMLPLLPEHFKIKRWLQRLHVYSFVLYDYPDAILLNVACKSRCCIITLGIHVFK